MRPIKFRAWEPFYKKMLPVVAVNPMNQTVYVSPVHLYGKPGDDVLLKYDETYEGMDSHVYLMQFTGLLDKNGKEVYEGDLVEHRNFINEMLGTYEVRWGTFGFTLFNPEQPEVTSHYITPSQLEVVGNIYENKELVK